MYECPNCAGNLKFDISRQQLFCAHCETTMDPYSFKKEKDAEEYEATIFTCPQCGGEIISDDTTAATFCSFCDGATILDSRISKERRPSFIIPFTKTKKDCKDAYAKMMSKAFFAPKELKDPEHLKKFRGIYMPYWVYSFEKKGPITFSGSKRYRRGDYVHVKHYDLDCEVDGEYKGISYDASSSFSDNLSSAIAPFDLKQSKPFEPTFLSGFYADTNDVDKRLYESEAEELMINDAVKVIENKSVCKRYDVKDSYSLRKALIPSKATAELAMLPVWFLSYRKGDRVCYAVVNGQTGKAAADLPVDMKNYLIGSGILALPLFILLNLLYTFTPNKILIVAAIMAFISILISNTQMSRIFAKEAGEDDKGLAAARAKTESLSQEEQDDLAGQMAAGRQQSAGTKSTTPIFKIILMVLGLTMMIQLLPLLLFPLLMMDISMEKLSILIVAVVFGITFFAIKGVVSVGKKKKKINGSFKRKLRTLAKPVVGISLALLVLLFEPVSDWYYYIAALVCMGSVIWAFLDIIKQHNILTTRKLPQFNKRGGDEYA